MKKLFTILAVLTLFALPTMVLAAGQQGAGSDNVSGQQIQQKQAIHEPGTGLKNSELKESTQLRQGTPTERATMRRSEISNAVQEMEKVATRNKGIGDQVRVMAQNQNQLQEKAENALGNAQKRGGFAKFFIGPNYGQLNEAKGSLEMHNEKLEELKTLRDDVSAADMVILDEQIEAMEAVSAELESEVEEETKGFSLFGWLNRLFSK